MKADAFLDKLEKLARDAEREQIRADEAWRYLYKANAELRRSQQEVEALRAELDKGRVPQDDLVKYLVSLNLGRIPIIKAVRYALGCGLKDAVDLVNKYLPRQ